MDYIETLEIHQCRACYNATNDLKLLTDLTKCGDCKQLSYAELLANVSNINILDDLYNGLPQFICGSCQCKLKAAQAFIKQTHQVNERLIALLSCQKEDPVQSILEYKDADVAAGFETRPHVKLKQELSEENPDGLDNEIVMEDGNNIMELTTYGINIENKESIEKDELLVESYPEEVKIESYPEVKTELIEYKFAEYNDVIIPDPVRRSSANQSVLPRNTYSFLKEPIKNQGILATMERILKSQEAILEGQKVLEDRLKKVEENQANILVNLGYLSNGQAALVTHQENIALGIDRCETNDKAQSVAQNKVLMECKVSIRNVEQSLCRMMGETLDHHLKEVASMFPLKTLEEVDSIEEKIQSTDFAMAVKTFMLKTKGMSEDVGEVIRSLMTDELLDKFNWEGRWEKKALGKLTLFDKLLRDVFCKQSSIDFERSLRKAVDKSHHRHKQKNYSKRNKEQK